MCVAKNTGTIYFKTWVRWWLLSLCEHVCVRNRGPSPPVSRGLHSLHMSVCVCVLCKLVVQIYRCVHMFTRCAKCLIQVGRQSDRQPRAARAAIVVQQLASQGCTHQVEHKSPLIRDSQVPLEWSAQQPITLLSWLA